MLTAGELRYYKNPEATHPLGTISLAAAAVFSAMHTKRGRCLTIRRPQPHRSYFLQTSSPSDFLHWLECIKSALPCKVRRMTTADTRAYQTLVLGREGSSHAEELQFALNGMISRDEEHQSPGTTDGHEFPASNVIAQAHSDLFTMGKAARDSKVQEALATVVAAICPSVWREVELQWDDTAFPLGLDFETLQGGQIAVKHTFGCVRAQNADIRPGDIIVALNSRSVQGWSLEEFFDRIRKVAPGANPVEHKTPNLQARKKANSFGSFTKRKSALPRRRVDTAPAQQNSLFLCESSQRFPVSTKISFTIARKLANGQSTAPSTTNLWEQDDSEDVDRESRHRKASSEPTVSLYDWV